MIVTLTFSDAEIMKMKGITLCGQVRDVCFKIAISNVLFYYRFPG